MTHAFHKLWIKIAALVIMAIAPILLLATMEWGTAPASLMIDLLAWPLDGQQTYATPEIRFLGALAGGFLLGWGITLWLISNWVYDHAPNAVRRAALFGALAWYVWDGLGSVLAGVPSNLVFNTGFLLIAVGPLWMPAKQAPAAERT